MPVGAPNTGDNGDYLSAAAFELRTVSRVSRIGGSILGRGRVIVPASGPGGFEIELLQTPDGATADFGGLTQDFSSFGEALNWAERAVLEDYRLRIDYAGRNPWRWTLEKMVRDGGVIEVFTSGTLLLFPWFRPRSTTFRQNIDPMKIN